MFLENAQNDHATYLKYFETIRNTYLKNPCVIATGLSDFYKLTAVTTKSQVVKAPPETTLYANYKNFDGEDFNQV